MSQSTPIEKARDGMEKIIRKENYLDSNGHEIRVCVGCGEGFDTTTVDWRNRRGKHMKRCRTYAALKQQRIELAEAERLLEEKVTSDQWLAEVAAGIFKMQQETKARMRMISAKLESAGFTEAQQTALIDLVQFVISNPKGWESLWEA